MEPPGLIKKIQHWVEDESHWLTHRKLIVLGVTLILIGLLLGIFDKEEAPEPVARPEIRDLTIPKRPEPQAEPDTGDKPPQETTAQAEVDQWQGVKVRPGQTLDAIFRQQGFDVVLLHRILKLSDETRRLTKIRPGDLFEFVKTADGRFDKMRYATDEAHYLLVQMKGTDPEATMIEREIFSEVAEAEGVIDSSLFLAGKKAGLSDAMIMKLANIFGWDIDFILDIREGDRFMLVYEKLYRDGEFLRDGEVLAATFINQGERFQAIRFEEGDVAGYFAPDGRNMKKAFLRAPLNFSYISSGFNPRRMHPVLKRVRPHNGIDYYAPRGTPVYAAGDGTVVRSDYSRANGHHVFIRHAGSIETRYLHFTKRTVKKGQKVRQGQTVGTVGSTGLATGPHLHYEFVVNGVHRNPRTVPLPKVEPLKGSVLASFQAKAAPMLTQLSRLESASLYASRD